MATTAVLHANDVHKADQSPHAVPATNSPLARGYSPGQSSNYNFAGVSPAETATASNCASASYQQASYPAQPSRDVYQNLTPEPPSNESTSLLELGPTTMTGSSSTTLNTSSETIYIRDPFYEPPRKRTPNSQRPPHYANSGNPLHSGIQLDLPRNVRVPYPDSAFEAVNAANKAFASMSGGMCIQPRPRPLPYMAAQIRNAPYAGHTMSNCISPSYASSTPPPPGGMSPSYAMHPIRAMSCPKPGVSQVPPGPYQYYAMAGSTAPPVKKQSSLTSGKKTKQNSKTSQEERTGKGSRKAEFCLPPVNNVYEQACEMGRPSTSAAGAYGMIPAAVPTNSGMGIIGGQSPSANNPSTSQMMPPAVRPHYLYDGAPMPGSAPNMQMYETMRPVNSPGSELMQPPPLPMMRANGHVNGTKAGDGSTLPKTSMYSQQSGVIQEMPPDGVRLCDARSSLKSPQYQVSPLAHSNQVGDVYGNLNGAMTNSPSYMQPNMMPLQRCAYCKEEIRADRIGIQCTGNNQGCRRYFHQECSQLLPESFHAILNEPRAEWICSDCSSRQHVTYS